MDWSHHSIALRKQHFLVHIPFERKNLRFLQVSRIASNWDSPVPGSRVLYYKHTPPKPAARFCVGRGEFGSDWVNEELGEYVGKQARKGQRSERAPFIFKD